MATTLRAVLLGILCSVAAGLPAKAASPRTLEIYFIDVEGGQATLLVTPEKHSLLIDAGWASDGKGFSPGDPKKARDANRIVAAARDAGISQIDHLLVTHFHTDHFGGVSELAQLIPIRGFIDHGAPHPHASETDSETRDAFALYSTLRSKGARHLEPRPGDQLPLSDLEVTVVSSAGATLRAPLPGAGAMNPTCPQRALPAGDPDENPWSTGVLVRYGKFRFLDVGDLSGQPLFALVCPRNLVGNVDAYLTAHHGGADAAEPATLAAFRPRVVMMNNGVRKGGQRAMFEVLHRASGIEHVWQLHTSADAGDINFPAEYIANVDDSAAYWIKLVANEDGSFRVLNSRTKQWKNYAAR
jgi:beta-lactamase superfamily II metal-dependent hydrolase